MKPYVHAQNSTRKFGGMPEDYIAIHNFLDSSKGTIPDYRHRALTHNSWFIAPDGPLEKAFGVTITNSAKRKVSVRDIGEQHILEDFGMRFIPSAQDYLQRIDPEEWMVRGKGSPPSYAKLFDRITQAIKNVVKRGSRAEAEPPVPPPAPGLILREDAEAFIDGANRYRFRNDILD